MKKHNIKENYERLFGPIKEDKLPWRSIFSVGVHSGENAGELVDDGKVKAEKFYKDIDKFFKRDLSKMESKYMVLNKDREYLGLKKEVQKLYSGEGRATMEDGYEVEQAVEAVFELEAFLRDFIS